MKKVDSSTKYRLTCDYGKNLIHMRLFDDRALAEATKKDLEKSTGREWTMLEAERPERPGERAPRKTFKGKVAKDPR